jgi:hypothetical protein
VEGANLDLLSVERGLRNGALGDVLREHILRSINVFAEVEVVNFLGVTLVTVLAYD